VNATTTDTTGGVKVPTVALTPKWVTTANMNATVVKDKYVPASQLCTGSFAADCSAAGITP
jgi:D-xylose transport system substrate-binding protein